MLQLRQKNPIQSIIIDMNSFAKIKIKKYITKKLQRPDI